MKRILAVALLSCCTTTPLVAAPLYGGLQAGADSVGALLGYQIDGTFAVEAHYTRSSTSVTNAGLTVDTTNTGKGLVGIAAFPMKLREVVPYSLFVKAGWERTSSNEEYSIPPTVTLTQPYNGTLNSSKNQLILGAGAEYDYSRNVTWRMGLDFVGKDRDFNLAAIFRF